MDSMDTFHLRTLNFRIFRLLKSAFIPFWLCYSQDIHSPGQGHSSTRAAIGLSEESRVLQPWQQLTKSQPESPGKCDQISCWHQDSRDIVLQSACTRSSHSCPPGGRNSPLQFAMKWWFLHPISSQAAETFLLYDLTMSCGAVRVYHHGEKLLLLRIKHFLNFFLQW
jgi:hypothetical protein